MFCAGQNIFSRPATSPFMGAASVSFFPALPDKLVEDSRIRFIHRGNKGAAGTYEDQEPQVLGVMGGYDGTKFFTSVQRFFADAKNVAEEIFLSPGSQTALYFASSNIALIPVAGAWLMQGAAAASAMVFGVRFKTVALSSTQLQINALLQQLQSPDSHAKLEAINALAAHVSNYEVRAAILGEANDSNIAMQSAAIRALAGLIAEPEIQYLFKGKLQPRHGLLFADELFLHEGVVKAIDSISDDKLKKELYLYAINIHYPERKVAGDRPPLFLHIVYQHALGFLKKHFNDNEVASVLIKGLAHPSERVSNAIAEFLADKIDDPLVKAGFLEYGPKNPSKFVRMKTIEFLERWIDEPQVLAAIIGLLNDPDKEVALAAADVLERVLEISSAGENYIELKKNVARAMAASEPANEPLSRRVEDLLRDENQRVRVAAAAGLLPRVAEPSIRTRILEVMRGYKGPINELKDFFVETLRDPKLTDLFLELPSQERADAFLLSEALNGVAAVRRPALIELFLGRGNSKIDK